MKSFRKELKKLKDKDKFLQKDFTFLGSDFVYFDSRNQKGLFFGKEAVSHMRTFRNNKLTPVIYSHNGISPLKFECWHVESTIITSNPHLITQSIRFQMENGDFLIWPPRYADISNRIYPLLGIEK